MQHVINLLWKVMLIATLQKATTRVHIENASTISVPKLSTDYSSYRVESQRSEKESPLGRDETGDDDQC